MTKTMLVFCTLVYAVSLSASVLAPDKPRRGDQVQISYTSSDGPYADSTGLTAQVLILRGTNTPVLLEPAFAREGTVWHGAFVLADSQATFLICRFATEKSIDDRGGTYWTAFVHGADGKPVQGAHYAKASWLNGQMPIFKVQRDMEAAQEEIAGELALYPRNVPALHMRWSLLQRRSPGDITTAAIKQELERAYAANKDDGEALAILLRWFEQTGQKSRADSLRSAAVAADPRGPVAKQQRMQQIFTNQDPGSAAQSLEHYIADFPLQADERASMLAQLSRMYAASGQIDKAAAVLDNDPTASPLLYNDLAWTLAEKGERLEDASRWARLAVDRLRSPSPAARPPYVSEREWASGNRSSLGMVLDTYGFVQQKLGQRNEAVKAYAEAYALTVGGDPEMNDRYVRSLAASGDPQKAIMISEAAVRSGRSNDSLVAAYRSAYVAVHGSEQGFSDALGKAKGEAAQAAKNELAAGMLSTPAPEFALKTLDGNTVALKDLRGKIVLIDYWATWCGPCKRSFPFLQQVYEKYRKDPRVAIFAIDTWEREKGTAREATVKKFLAENKYTFPVLYDDASVEKYGVEGIPTKFMIDQKGIIRFKSVGFESGEKMLAEIDAQLAMLLKPAGQGSK